MLLKNMQVILDKPPIYSKAKELFNLNEDDVIFFTYGNKCYSPSGKMPPDYLIVHESKHMEQQNYDSVSAKIWWELYFADANFRMEQEIEAYGEQYKFICQGVKDRNKQHKYLWGIAEQLSGTMYGNCISHSQAMKRIKEYANGKDIKTIEDHIKDDVVEL